MQTLPLPPILILFLCCISLFPQVTRGFTTIPRSIHVTMSKTISSPANWNADDDGCCRRRRRRRRQMVTRHLNALPKLIVFDLDNTLWTPELYQLRRKLQQQQQSNTNKGIIPKAGQDVQLMKGAKLVLQKHVPILQQQGVQFAVASRTKSVEWAHALLGQFELRHIFSHIEIFPANKQQHFEKIQQASGLSYQDMLFFDDARDGKFGNCEPVALQGVLAVHCPNGLDSEQIFLNAMEKYKQWDKSPGTIIEADGTMTSTTATKTKTTTKSIPSSLSHSKVESGIVKIVNMNKRYGWIQYNNIPEKDIFFHFNHLMGVVNVQKGDPVAFTISRNQKDGRVMATNISIQTDVNRSQIEVMCFSMNQPFAALVANGYKDIETRNGTMFQKFPPGTIMMLHVGRRVYPDGNKHIQIMKDGGLDDEIIRRLKSLPSGFREGQIVAILEIGRTFETTIEERSDPQFQRRVAAFGADSGRMATEIRRVAYLDKPIRMAGQSGVFKVFLDKSAIPKGW